MASEKTAGEYIAQNVLWVLSIAVLGTIVLIVVGVGFLIWMDARNYEPDRDMTYRVELAVDSVGSLVFDGKVFCAHHAGSYGGRYYTASGQSQITAYGREWILDGIDCEAMSRPGEVVPPYTLFEVQTGDPVPDYARVRFVADKASDMPSSTEFERPPFPASARVASQTYGWGKSYWRWHKLPMEPPPIRYSVGPFAYQKIQLQVRLPYLADAAGPIQVSGFENSCRLGLLPGPLSDYPPTIALASQEYRALKRIANESPVIEKGYLSVKLPHRQQRDQGDDSWGLVWGMDPSVTALTPMDAVYRQKWDGKKGRIQTDHWPECLTLSLPGGVVKTGMFMANEWVFLPKENVLIRIALLRRYTVDNYGDGKDTSQIWGR